MIHDVTIGALAGFTTGFVAGLFGLQFIDHTAVPFTVATIGAVIGARWLVGAGRQGTAMLARRLVAWVLFGLATTFLVMLMVAIATFE
ncbi:MAG TPA: hypothetical protein VIV08_04310 [Acidimicrobiia bacterium]